MPKRKRPSSKDFLSGDVPEIHEHLLDYVLSNNAKLSNVKIAKLPHGIGIVASGKLRKNEEITFIPKPLLLNVHDVPFPNSSPVDYPTRVHGSLAAYVADKKRNTTNDAFMSILPGEQSFRSSMPMFWRDEVLEHCSPWVIAFAKRQRAKLEDDYEHAVKVHVESGSKMEFTKEEYEWAWAAVNTRTIYYRPKKWYKAPAEDCMTMCPFIDYYNHDSRSEETCTVSFSPDGLTVTTQKSYELGEEIFVTYGEYSNEHLLVEYGFCLPENRSDNINIDFLVAPKISARCVELLKDISFHGYAFTFSKDMYSGSDLTISVNGDGESEYSLDTTGVCYRTMIALRLAVIPENKLPVGDEKASKRYQDFQRLLEGDIEEDDYTKKYKEDEDKVTKMVGEIITELQSMATSKITILKAIAEEGKFEADQASMSMATERWEQTLLIAQEYLDSQNR